LVSPTNVNEKDPAKLIASKNNIKNFTWISNNKDMEEALSVVRADLFIVTGFPHIFSKSIINLPKLGVINLHGGKLPNYRGSSPINWALINGDKIITISILKMIEEIDAGEILAEKSFKISDKDTAKSVLQMALKAFPSLLYKSIIKIQKVGKISGKKQNKKNVNYYPLRSPDDGFINFEVMKSQQILNLIRGLTPPFPGAFGILNGRKVFLLEVKKISIKFCGIPGKIYLVRGYGLIIMANDTGIEITRARFDNVNLGPLVNSKDLVGKRFSSALKVGL